MFMFGIFNCWTQHEQSTFHPRLPRATNVHLQSGWAWESLLMLCKLNNIRARVSKLEICILSQMTLFLFEGLCALSRKKFFFLLIASLSSLSCIHSDDFFLFGLVQETFWQALLSRGVLGRQVTVFQNRRRSLFWTLQSSDIPGQYFLFPTRHLFTRIIALSGSDISSPLWLLRYLDECSVQLDNVRIHWLSHFFWIIRPAMIYNQEARRTKVRERANVLYAVRNLFCKLVLEEQCDTKMLCLIHQVEHWASWINFVSTWTLWLDLSSAVPTVNLITPVALDALLQFPYSFPTFPNTYILSFQALFFSVFLTVIATLSRRLVRICNVSV